MLRGSPLILLGTPVEENEEGLFNARIINSAKLIELAIGLPVRTVQDVLVMKELYPDIFYQYFGPQTRIDFTRLCRKQGIPITTDFTLSKLWVNLFVFKKIHLN